MDNKFREAREAANLKQEEVAGKLGVSRTAYVRYENGQRECSYETLRKLSSIFNVSIDYLLGVENLNKWQIVLLASFGDLDSAGQEEVFNYISFVKHKQNNDNGAKKGKFSSIPRIGTHRPTVKARG